MNEEIQPRKVKLDYAVYCPFPVSRLGGRDGCDHDFPPEPSKDMDGWIEFTCTKCGRRVVFEIWE